MSKKTIFNKIKLDYLIDQVNCTKDIETRINQFEEDLIQILLEALDESEWSPEIFLAFALGFYFLDEIKRGKLVPESLSQGNSVFYRKPLEIDDIIELKSKISLLFKEQLSFFKKQTKSKSVPLFFSPYVLMELAEALSARGELSFFIRNGRLATLIRCKYFNLDIPVDDLKKIMSPLDLVDMPVNSEEEPEYFTYGQIKEKHKEEASNYTKQQCLQGLLIPCLLVPSDFISIAVQSTSDNYQDKPYYLKRHKGLERLKVKGDPYGFDLETLFKNGYLQLERSHLLNELDCTDIENKFHIRRTLRSFIIKSVMVNGNKHVPFKKNDVIKIKDLVFVKNDIKNLLHLLSEKELIEKIKQESTNSRLVRIRETTKKLREKDHNTTWKKLVGCVHQIEAPIYKKLGKNQPSLGSYIRWEREMRTKIIKTAD